MDNQTKLNIREFKRVFSGKNLIVFNGKVLPAKKGGYTNEEIKTLSAPKQSQ